MNWFSGIELDASQNVIIQYNNLIDNGDFYGKYWSYNVYYPHQAPPQIGDEAVQNISVSYNFYSDWITNATTGDGLYYLPNIIDDNITDNFPVVLVYRIQ